MAWKLTAANAALDAVIAGTRYLALHTGAPTAQNELTNANSPGYTRKAIASTGWEKTTSGSTRRARNSADVVFTAAASAAWEDATHVALWDAETGGNLLVTDDFSNDPNAPALGAEVKLDAGGVTLTATFEA